MPFLRHSVHVIVISQMLDQKVWPAVVNFTDMGVGTSAHLYALQKILGLLAYAQLFFTSSVEHPESLNLA